MKLAQLLDGIDIIEPTVDLDIEVSGLALDSRLVKPGDLFAAVPGGNIDRAEFSAMAVANGAVCVLTQRPVDAPYLLVTDCRKALSRMAANFYRHPSRQLKVIGITGTKGKTTTSFIVKQILQTCLGKPVGLIGTNGVYVGERHLELSLTTPTTPESIDLHAILRDMLDEGVAHVVMEVSAHALTLERVSDLDFAVGVYTNLSQDHLDFYDDMDSYFAAKLQLFPLCRNAVVNLDGARGEQVAETASCPTVTVSTQFTADITAKNLRLLPRSVEFTVCHEGSEVDTSLKVPGRFSVENALTALGVAVTLGVSLDDAAAALKHCGGVAGRCEVVPTPNNLSVIIDYAHSPDSLEKILATLKASCDGRLICVFGCGGDRDKSKRRHMGAVVQRNADVSVVTSDNPRTERPDAIIADILEGMDAALAAVIPDRRQAIYAALDMAGDGDTVLLAGKGQETYQEVDGVKHHMDEREIVADYFAQASGADKNEQE